MDKSKIPTILGIFFLVVGLATGVVLVQNKGIFRLGASLELSPKNVRISNVSDNSLTISWTTEKEVLGFVQWGIKSSSLNKTSADEYALPSFTHAVTLRSLSPQTTYFFKINSGSVSFDNNGTPWQAKTGPTISVQPKTNIVSGEILSASGVPAKNALVYLTVGGGLLSTTTSEGGTYVLPISSARTQDLSSYVLIDEESSLLEIFVDAGPSGVSSAQIYPVSAKPAPSILLGRSFDFKNLAPKSDAEIPKASIDLPQESTPSSGFEVPQGTLPPSTKVVTLESIEEGEVVSTADPEFFGKGPPDTAITISVESEPLTGQAKVDKSGGWKWSPSESLEPGTHKIKISWRDASGVLRTLTRTFIVQAAESPAFEATPSATPTPTPSPTATPGASPKPSPSASATPAATPIAQPAIPESGSLTATLLLSIMGIGVLIFSFLIWKQSELEG